MLTTQKRGKAGAYMYMYIYMHLTFLVLSRATTVAGRKEQLLCEHSFRFFFFSVVPCSCLRVAICRPFVGRL